MDFRCFLIEISFCWPMNPCQTPSDWVYSDESPSYSVMSRRMMSAVYWAISRPVLNRFCARMRATYSGLIASQLEPFCSLRAWIFSMSSVYAVISTPSWMLTLAEVVASTLCQENYVFMPFGV